MNESAASPPSQVRVRRPRQLLEHGIQFLLAGSALISVLTTVGILIVLISNAAAFFQVVSVAEFLTGTRWAPILEPTSYGVLPLLCGTMLVAVGSAIIAIPLGLGTAIYLSEYAGPLVRNLMKPLLELLAGIPSVVYGYVAIVVVSPLVLATFRWVAPTFERLLQVRLEEPKIFNALNACVVVGIMILPMIVSLSEDVLRAVPRSLREGAYALGANKYDVTTRVVVPAAMSGILASCLLAISRAVGETMAVSLAAGSTPNMTLNPLETIQTMTAFIVQISSGDVAAGTIKYKTIFAVGLTLFACTMAMNLLAQFILAWTREKYE